MNHKDEKPMILDKQNIKETKQIWFRVFESKMLVSAKDRHTTLYWCVCARVCVVWQFVCVHASSINKPDHKVEPPEKGGCRCCWRSQKRTAPMKIKPQDAEETQSFPYYLTLLSNMLLEFEHTNLRNGSAESNPCPTRVDGKRYCIFHFFLIGQQSLK